MLGRGAGQTEEGRPGWVERVGPAPQAHNPLDQGVLLHAGPASQPVKKRGLKVVSHHCLQKVNHNPTLLEDYKNGLINYIDTKAKCCHLKKFTCKGTSRQVFIRVYRLEIRSVMLVFSTKLCELLSF